MKGVENLTVLGYDLGGELVVRMFKLLKGRNLCKQSYKQKREE